MLYETAAVPVHVEMDPPLPPPTEQNVTAEMTRANAIVDRLEHTSAAVNRLTQRLKANPNANDRAIVERELGNEIEAALYQGGVAQEMVPGFAHMMAHNIARGIRMVETRRRDSIVVYFLCKTVKAHYDLGQMIVSGFMHAVFAVAIQSVARTTVDVYVRADEFNIRLLCLSNPQHKGLSVDGQQLLTTFS